MTASARSPLRSLRSLHGERATPLRVNSKPDTSCALKPDTSICPQQILYGFVNAKYRRGACAVGYFGSVCVARGFSARGLKADRVWWGADEGFAEVRPVPYLAKAGPKTTL